MIEKIKNFKINWIDGMKISKEHFQGLQNYAENSVKDAFVTRNGRYGYGYFTSRSNSIHNDTINLDIHNSLRVSINELRAITPNGHRIEVTNETPRVEDQITISNVLDTNCETGFLLINLDIENPVPFGEQDAKEVPPRHPFVTNGHFFSFIDAKELEKTGLLGNQLPIAKITRVGNVLSFTTDYIPPCTSLDAHVQLMDFYNEVDNFLKMAERNCITILQKIRSKDNENPIADAMQLAVDKLYVYLAQKITTVKWEAQYLHPKDLLEILVSFARIFKGAVDISSPEEKERLLNYFGDWTDLKGGDYEKIFNTIINLKYNHDDVNENVKTVSVFMETIEKLLKVLTQVDY
ncbi:hypothetical protein LCGC14_1560940, partial [marine sediment metagenome]